MRNYLRWQAKGLLIAGLVAASSGAQAADGPLCLFLKKLLPSASTEFAAWKGDVDTTLSPDEQTDFHGTLTPGADVKCTLYVRRLVGKEIAEPQYSCILTKNQTFKQAVAVYNDAAAQIRACYPAWKFTEQKSGSVAKREEIWELKAKPPGLEVSMGFSDLGLLSDLLSSKPSNKPGVLVSLDVHDMAPAAKDHPPLPSVGGANK